MTEEDSMTNQNDTTDAETSSAGSQSPVDERNDVSEAEGEQRKPPREARYRVERNEARAERDALREQIRQLQTREAERIASHGLSNPADLFTLGEVELSDLVGEDGSVDPDRVSEVVSGILGSRPGLRPNAPAFDPTQGQTSQTPKREPTWGALLG